MIMMVIDSRIEMAVQSRFDFSDLTCVLSSFVDDMLIIDNLIVY